MKKILSLFAAVLLCAFAANAATVNVSPGTKAIYSAYKTAAAGDILILADGTYDETERIVFDKSITIQSADDAKPIVKFVKDNQIKSGAAVEIIGVKFDGSAMVGTYEYVIRAYDATAGNKIRLDNCEVTGFASASTNYFINASGASRTLDSIIINNCYFHDSKGDAVYVGAGSAEQETCQGVIVTNSTFANLTPYHSVIDVNNYGNTMTSNIEVTVDHCTFYNNPTTADGYAGVRSYKSTNVNITNSIFVHSESYAKCGTYCYGGTVSHCLTYNFTAGTNGHRAGPELIENSVADPKFKDAAGGDFTLADDSPALGKGTDESNLGDPRWWPAAEEPAEPQVLYLKPGVWAADGAKFAIWDMTHSQWSEFMALAENETEIYTASIAADATQVIFVRLKNTAETANWDDKWNQTADLDLVDGKDLYTVTGWNTSDGEWSKYEYVAPETPAKFYITGNAALVGEELKWNPAAIESMEDSYTLSLKADVDYMLKLTLNGTWEGDNNVKGFDALTVVADGLTRGEDDNNDNICFKLAEDGDVTVTYKVVEDVVTFKLEGNFYVAPVAKFYIAGSMTEWDANMIPVYEDSYVLELEAGDHKLKVVDGGIWLGYIALSEKAEGLSKDDDGYICFTLAKAGNVTVTYGDDVFTVEGNFYINPWESWFTGPGSDNWGGETDSKLVYDQENKKATITIAQDKDAQWKAQAKYQGLLTENGKFYHVGLKIKANHAMSGVTIKWENNTGILMENASISLEEATEFVYDKPLVHVTKAGGDGVLVLDFGQAKTGDVIEIYDVVIEEVDAPVVDLEDGYYLIGLKGWTIYDLAADDKFAQGETEGEYELELALANGDEFKVVTIIDNQFGAWFPGEAGNYHVDLAHAGDAKTVYFRPDYSGNEDWHAGCIFIHANDVPFNPIVNTYFADPSWAEETESSAVWDSENKKVTVSIAIDKINQWQAQVFFQTIIPSAGKWYRFSVKLKANNAIENVTIKYQNNAEMFYDPHVALEKDVEREFVKVVPGLVGDGVIAYDFGYAKAGDVIEIYDLSVEEIDAPALNYYVAGTINEWAIADDQYEFEANEQAEGEFIAHAELAEGDKIKVISVQGDKVVWFPGDNPGDYVVDAAHAGVVTIYFRPNYDGGEGWHGGCIFVQKDQTTGIDNADATVKAMKMIENGQLIIIRDGNRYNTLGQKF